MQHFYYVNCQWRFDNLTERIFFSKYFNLNLTKSNQFRMTKLQNNTVTEADITENGKDHFLSISCNTDGYFMKVIYT